LSAKQLNCWQSKYGKCIDFVCVYIAEAHTNNVWPLGRHIDIPSHISFEDRVAASDILINKYEFKIPVMYDTMTNEFDQYYAVWPERYYIIKDNKMDFIFSPTVEFGFNRDQLEKKLNDRLDSIQKIKVYVKNIV